MNDHQGEGSHSTKASLWRQHFSRWKASGLSQKKYCERESISLATFHYWRKKLFPKASSSRLRLVPLKPAPTSQDATRDPSRSRRIRVMVGDLALEINSSIEPVALKRLILAMSEAACGV